MKRSRGSRRIPGKAKVGVAHTNWNHGTSNMSLLCCCRYVTHVKFAPSGLFLATASNDRTVKIWELETPETRHKEMYSGWSLPDKYKEASILRSSIQFVQ